jgi:hypothetical protein
MTSYLPRQSVQNNRLTQSQWDCGCWLFAKKTTRYVHLFLLIIVFKGKVRKLNLSICLSKHLNKVNILNILMKWTLVFVYLTLYYGVMYVKFSYAYIFGYPYHKNLWKVWLRPPTLFPRSHWNCGCRGFIETSEAVSMVTFNPRKTKMSTFLS